MLDPVGGVLFLTVLSGVPWTFSYHADWIIEITPQEGMGVGVVSVRYEANEGDALRQTVISVQTNDWRSHRVRRHARYHTTCRWRAAFGDHGGQKRWQLCVLCAYFGQLVHKGRTDNPLAWR